MLDRPHLEIEIENLPLIYKYHTPITSLQLWAYHAWEILNTSGLDRNKCNDGKNVLHTRICSAKSLFTFVTSFMQEGP